MVALTFPDGARREYPENITGLDIAKGISPSLAKRTVAMALDGTVQDLADPIETDARRRRPRFRGFPVSQNPLNDPTSRTLTCIRRQRVSNRSE